MSSMYWVWDSFFNSAAMRQPVMLVCNKKKFIIKIVNELIIEYWILQIMKKILLLFYASQIKETNSNENPIHWWYSVFIQL